MTLGFFDDILIPPTAMQHPSRFEETEQAWVWKYPTGVDGEHHDLYMDIGEPIKFRITGETFEESSPVGPAANESAASASAAAANAANMAGTGGGGGGGGQSDTAAGILMSSADTIKTPYRIVVAINESGLGLLSWWDQNNQSAATENDDDEGEEYEE